MSDRRWCRDLILSGCILMVNTMGARPSLPPMEVLAGAENETAERAMSAGRSEGAVAAPIPADTRHWWHGMLRAYEPTAVGYTLQDGDDSFMDFSISLMIPVLHNVYPDRMPERRRALGGTAGRSWYPYFAFTGRAGQYLGTRSSSPVVGKRFNPVFILRHWNTDMSNPAEAEPDRYLDLVYGHESNGQWIDDPETFATVSRLHPSFKEVRDEISRGWDYVGLNFSERGHWLPGVIESQRLQIKLSHYLADGFMQGAAEEYAGWEADPQGKRRRDVDGIEVRFDLVQPIALLKDSRDQFGFSGRLGITWMTGIGRPWDYHTFEIEAGLLFNGFPVGVWYRRGYMADLTDYYQRLESAGVRVSFWQY